VQLRSFLCEKVFRLIQPIFENVLPWVTASGSRRMNYATFAVCVRLPDPTPLPFPESRVSLLTFLISHQTCRFLCKEKELRQA
jgi:hypothetical protein